MKIAIVSKYFPPNILGGGEISAYNLAQALTEIGVDVHVITSTNIHQLEESRFTLHPIIKDVSMPGLLNYLSRNEVFYWKSYKAVSKFLSDNSDIDVVHAMNMTSIPGTVKAAIKHDISSVITISSHWLTCPTGMMLKSDDTVCDGKCSFMKTLQCYSNSSFSEMLLGTMYSPIQMHTRKKYASKADAVVSISKSVEGYAKQVINPKRSYVIPNIINAEEYNVDPEEEYRSNILFLGALIKPKGCEYLIRAMPKIAKEHPKVVLRILGDGAEYDYLRKLSERSEIEKNVVFEGVVPHVKTPLYYASTDVVVFPSIWPEPFGRISVEAMAAGKPVVASNVGGISDTIEHGKTGLLVETRNSKRIAEAVLQLIEDENMQKRMGEEGRKLVKEKYSADVIGRKYLEVYSSAKIMTTLLQ
jgi:glycosyltransferase involved in cell wall biosynthesis